MVKTIGNWLNVYEEEIGLFLWTVVLLFVVRSAGIFLNNFAETAFLKRYGVEYMPIVNMVNAVVTFFSMGIVTGFATRLPGARLLSRLFVFCGLTVAAIRVTIPFGIEWVYPLLFMMKSQYEVLLGLLFWNLANDLFNTRQSKRLFPLITAGGVIGQILGSFATPMMARWFYMDNLLVIYTATTLTGAWVVQAMGRRYPTILFQQNMAEKATERTSLVTEFKNLLPLIRSSVLLKILVVLTFMPNVVIPIMNYQFNFAVNDQFATESGLIEFFGYFRGVLNIISLVILLFVGKLYDRFGLPVALMFHPFNYILVFMVFLFRFDALGAMYARMSSNIIRTTINIPATAVVTGLFPESYRAMVRPFLRGTVVRLGLFLGSGLILISENLFHPRYLSFVALPFVLAWLVAPFVLKRRYAGILLDLIDDDGMDLHTLNTDELQQVFKDRDVQLHLLDRFWRESGENRLWIGQLLKPIGLKDLDDHVLAMLDQDQPVRIRIGLVDLLSDQAGPAAVNTFKNLIDTGAPQLIVAMIDAGQRMSKDVLAPFFEAVYQSRLPLDVKARALGVLHQIDPKTYAPLIQQWIAADHGQTLSAGIIAAGMSQDADYADPLKGLLLSHANDDEMLLQILDSLRRIPVKGLNPLIVMRLCDPDPRMRRAILDVYQIEDEASLKNVIPLLGDEKEDIAGLAYTKIKTAGFQNSLRLIKSLSLPSRKVREALFDLLSDMAIKDLDVYRFVQLQARMCYQLIVQAQGVRQLPDNVVQQQLAVHLDERVWFALQTTLRVLAVQDQSGRMQKISRGIFSSDKRQRANSLEAMDDILNKKLKRLLMPLFEDMDIDERIAAGKKRFPDAFYPNTPTYLIVSLLGSRNWVTLVLTLALIEQRDEISHFLPYIEHLFDHDNPDVAQAAHDLLIKHSYSSPMQEDVMQAAKIPLSDKILYLKKIEIFSGLSVNELAAVAAATKEAFFDQGATVFEEGDRGETLFFVVDGEVAVIKDCNTDKQIELDIIGTGDYFGEMALFVDDRRSATIRVKKAARFLTLHKQELQEIVREFPQIALHVCRVLSMRIRHLHTKISAQSC